MQHIVQLSQQMNQRFPVGIQHEVFEAFMYIIDKCIEEENKLQVDMAKFKDNDRIHQSIKSWIHDQKNTISDIYAKFYCQTYFECSDGEQRWSSLCGFIIDLDQNEPDIRISKSIMTYMTNLKQQFTRLAPILVFNLHNISKQYQKPITLELYLTFYENGKPCVYQLKSMILHHGSFYGGHYNCIVYDYETKKYILCDDERIQEFPTDEQNISHFRIIPAMMIYEKIDE